MITASAKAILKTWICPWCRAVCNDVGVLHILTDKQFKRTLKKDSQANHGICDGCKDKQMIEIAKFKRRRK